MKITLKVLCSILTMVFVFLLLINPAKAEELTVPPCAAGVQSTGSIYEIYMPPPTTYNGRFVIWAHGFQDANKDVGIPYDQMCFNGTCISDLLLAFGIGFGTNSYSKVGLAVREGMADITDLVDRLAYYGRTDRNTCGALGLTENPEIFISSVPRKVG